MGDGRYLTFTQVLLRSSAIEELLAYIVCNDRLRMELLAAWSAVRGSQPESGSEAYLAATLLFQILSKILRGDDLVWFDVVLLLLSPHGHDRSEKPEDTLEEDERIRERSNSSADWWARCERSGFRALEIGIISRLKKDWYDDWLEKERRDLAANVDLKRNELVQRASPTSSALFSSPNGHMWHKIQLSSELVDLYESVRDNLDECTMHRAGVKKELIAALEAKRTQAARAQTEADEGRAGALGRQTVVHENMDAMEKEFRPRLEAVLEERTAIEFKISSLEEQKLRLKMELERVSQELNDAMNAQRDATDYESQLRVELSTSREKFTTILRKEEREENECSVDAELNTRCVAAVNNMIPRVEKLHAEAANELNDIYTQFDNAFVEAVQDHMTVLCDSVQEIYRRTKRVADEMEAVKRTKGAQSVSEMLNSTLNESEKEEFSAAAERLNLKLVELGNRLREDADDVAKFDTTFNDFFNRFQTKLTSNRLLKGEVDKIRVVFAETAKIIDRYDLNRKPAPSPKGPELLIEESPESPRPLAGSS